MRHDTHTSIAPVLTLFALLAPPLPIFPAGQTLKVLKQELLALVNPESFRVARFLIEDLHCSVRKDGYIKWGSTHAGKPPEITVFGAPPAGSGAFRAELGATAPDRRNTGHVRRRAILWAPPRRADLHSQSGFYLHTRYVQIRICCVGW